MEDKVFVYQEELCWAGLVRLVSITVSDVMWHYVELCYLCYVRAYGKEIYFKGTEKLKLNIGM